MPLFNPNEVVIETAKLMCTAARTAPKTKGVDLLTVFFLLPDEFAPLVTGLEQMSQKYDHLRSFRPYERDLDSLRNADALVVIGSRRKLMDIAGCDACGFSGDPNGCKAAAKAGATCAYNAKDLGIALCSAALIAHQRLIDNRIIDTVGRVIVNEKLYPEYCPQPIFDAAAVGLSVSGKNPFFDRLEMKQERKANAGRTADRDAEAP